MLQRANAKESEGRGPCGSLKEGRTGELNICTSMANPGYDARDPTHKRIASGSKDCRSIFSYMAFRTCGSTSLETRARDERSWWGRNCATFSHICEGMVCGRVLEVVDKVDAESDRVSHIDVARLSKIASIS